MLPNKNKNNYFSCKKGSPILILILILIQFEIAMGEHGFATHDEMKKWKKSSPKEKDKDVEVGSEADESYNEDQDQVKLLIAPFNLW